MNNYSLFLYFCFWSDLVVRASFILNEEENKLLRPAETEMEKEREDSWFSQYYPSLWAFPCWHKICGGGSIFNHPPCQWTVCVCVCVFTHVCVGVCLLMFGPPLLYVYLCVCVRVHVQLAIVLSRCFTAIFIITIISAAFVYLCTPTFLFLHSSSSGFARPAELQ